MWQLVCWQWISPQKLSLNCVVLFWDESSSLFVPAVHLKLWLHFALWWLFFKLIDSKHQILWAHNAACPHVDCKFLLGVVCGCIDLKSVCITFRLWLPLHLSSFCVCTLWLHCFHTMYNSHYSAGWWPYCFHSVHRMMDGSIYFFIHVFVDVVMTAKSHWNCLFAATEWPICFIQMDLWTQKKCGWRTHCLLQVSASKIHSNGQIDSLSDAQYQWLL